jgi:transcriptional regulator with XRE-family HTH domain
MPISSTSQAKTPLRVARRRANLTQLELASRARCCIQTISLAERTGHLTLPSAEKLARALGVNPSELMS